MERRLFNRAVRVADDVLLGRCNIDQSGAAERYLELAVRAAGRLGRPELESFLARTLDRVARRRYAVLQEGC